MGYKKLATRKLFSHPRLELLEDEIELPDGSRSTYLYFGSQKDCVTIICVREDDTVMMQKETSYPIGKKIWQFPGGAMEKGETPLQAADRELHEEAQQRATHYELAGSYYMNNRRSNARMHVVVANELVSASGRSPDVGEVDIEHHWLSQEQVRQAMINETHSHTLAAWALYQATRPAQSSS